MWLYKDKEINGLEDLPEGVFGFVYITTHLPTNKKYIGKKSLVYKRKKKLTKKELLEYQGKRGRTPTHKQIEFESDWMTYYGSNGFIKDCVKECPEELTREILEFADTKIQLTYLECRYQFILKVLEDKQYLNDNILGKFYSKDL